MVPSPIVGDGKPVPPKPPVVVPDKIFGLTLTLDFIDRGHSLRSLLPPLVALPSLPLVQMVSKASAPSDEGAV